MITIDEFMTPNPWTLRASDTLGEARRIMTEKHIRHIPITDDDGHLQGLVTQRDVLAATGPDVDEHADIPLADIMIRDVSTIVPNSPARQAAIFLQSHKYGCLPVEDNGRLTGIITDSDFISIAINLLEQAELTEEADMFDEDVLDDI